MTYDLMNRWNSQEITALVPFHSRRGPQYRHRPRSLPRLSLGPTPEWKSDANSHSGARIAHHRAL